MCHLRATPWEICKTGRSCQQADYGYLYEYDLGEYYTLDIRFPIWKHFAEKLNVCLLSVEHRFSIIRARR